MKAILQLPRIAVEVEGGTQKEVFAEMARAAEIFGEETCGQCDSPNIKPVCRVVGEGKATFTYYEWHCKACFARLSLGQSQDGESLFPKRKLDSQGKPDNEKGTYGPHRGWTHYKGDKAGAEGDGKPEPAAATAPVRSRR